MKLRPRAILIDLDNTVYDYAPCQKAGMEALRQTVEKRKGEWPAIDSLEQEYNEARRATANRIPDHAASHCRFLYLKNLVEKKFGESRLELVVELHEAFWRGYLDAMRPDKGCAEALMSVANSGVRLAWVTNFTTERQVSKLKQLGFLKLAQFLITSEEAGADKPSVKPFQLALEKLNCAAKDAVMVGDDWEADIEAAQKLGITPIWRSRGEKAAPGKVLQFDQWTEFSSFF